MSLSPIFDHFRCSMKLTILLSFNLLQLQISYIYLFCIVTWSPKKWTSTLTKMLFNRFFIFCFRTNSFSTITICMGQFKKYVTPKITIFRPPPPCHTLSYFASTPSPPCHSPKSDKLWPRKLIKNNHCHAIIWSNNLHYFHQKQVE